MAMKKKTRSFSDKKKPFEINQHELNQALINLENGNLELVKFFLEKLKPHAKKALKRYLVALVCWTPLML